MNLATIRMPRQKARERFLEYRRAIKERHDEEYEAIMRGYRELSRGRQLLSLNDTMGLGGLKQYTVKEYNNVETTRMYPAFAIMRADREVCFLTRFAETCVFEPERWYRGRRDRITVPLAAFPDRANIKSTSAPVMKAMVPLVPAALRPRAKLSNYHILWEATWEQADKGRTRAPRDPALLRHLGGDLYVVLALWDLTPVERAVLAGRSV